METGGLEPLKRTLHPIVTSGSVLGIRYKDGVMLASDTQASYGRMARYKRIDRYIKFGKSTLMAASGEYSDFQHLTEFLGRVDTEDWAEDDNCHFTASEVASLLSRVMYQRRSKFNPLWNSIVVAGCDPERTGDNADESMGSAEGHQYLGYVDMYGTHYEENYVCTGLGRYFAITHMRNLHRPDMTEEEARKLLEDCMRLLFLRDCNASNRIQIGKVTTQGIDVGEPYELDTQWALNVWTEPTSALSLAGCSW
eukprot:GHVT01027763.1.p1 GENE.GHVT01027763.1~~GHVT01027763.1.p1  ORF type:complete len:253 (+),score=16.67 GHVT01027763.1:155-913(+)